MKSMLKLAATAAITMLAAGTAYAQVPQGPSGVGPAGPGYGGGDPAIHNGGESTARDAVRAREDAVDAERVRAGSTKASSRSVPAKPEEIVTGAEVHDRKGAVLGKVESVSVGSAVIVTAAGKVELPLEVFGKNAKGLLLDTTKSDFEKAVAEANTGA